LTGCARKANRVTAQETKQIAEEAYICGYPLVTMEMTRRVMTNVEQMKGSRGPMMYDDAYFFADNPLNRYKVSSRSKFAKNADGSVDVYIQKDSPGKDKEANWLPAPAGRFVLMLRLYMPSPKAPSILDGSWKIPPVKKVD
jgi:hypothetical protein